MTKMTLQIELQTNAINEYTARYGTTQANGSTPWTAIQTLGERFGALPQADQKRIFGVIMPEEASGASHTSR